MSTIQQTQDSWRYRLGRVAIHFGREATRGWSACIAVAVRLEPLLAWCAGFGWDAEHPLRPWPWFNLRADGTGWTLSWGGLFLTVRYAP